MPSALRAFATAAARRYSGQRIATPPVPRCRRVAAWQAWNEPNLAIYLAPQWVRRGGTWRPFSPGWYRRLLNGVYAGVKAVQPRRHDRERGNGAVRRSARPLPDATRRVHARVPLPARPSPATRSSVADPAHFDVLAHHPYSVGGPDRHAIHPDDVGVPDLASLTKPLRKAERNRRALPRKRKALWVTEISWDSSPPDPQGVPIARHAQWLQESRPPAVAPGRTVVLWLNIADQLPAPRYDDTYQSGLFFSGRSAEARAHRVPVPVRQHMQEGPV